MLTWKIELICLNYSLFKICFKCFLSARSRERSGDVLIMQIPVHIFEVVVVNLYSNKPILSVNDNSEFDFLYF